LKLLFRGFMEAQVCIQESISWDPQFECIQTSPATTAYVMALVIVWVVGVVKMLRVWRGALPLGRLDEARGSECARAMQSTCESLTQWMTFLFLGLGLLLSLDVRHICDMLIRQTGKARVEIAWPLEEASTVSALAFVTAGFLFLIRWHLRRRIVALEKG
jgi:hypothetical protein